ncbi:MAG: hypothetical protein AVO39_07235 [delta proteobacterium MLS_D]|jgi:outer membrane protein insertion porin family|nr:MAG: hypothetical protein AVO39_07235 [delta proteobacterium MLS_D]
MNYNHLTKLVMVILTLLLVAPQISAAEETRKIALFPFSINSETDVSFLRERIAGSIRAEILKQPYIQVIDREVLRGLVGDDPPTERSAVEAGRQVGADYVVTGSLTKLGELISADVRVVELERGVVLRDLFAQGRGIESVDTIAADLVNEMLVRLFARLRIAEVRFEGNQLVEDDALYNAIEGTRGTLFSRHVLSEDIRSLYQMGHFSDVKAEVAESPEGRIITFTLKERPRIAEIRIEGNRKVNERDIRDILTIKPRQLYDPDETNNDAENIRMLYKERGYLNSRVSFVAEGEKEGRDVTVVFTVEEHRKPSIKSISFEGNKVYTDKELRKMMEVSEWGIFHFLTDAGLFNRSELERDVERLTVFYHNNGFIDAQIGEPEIKTDERWIYITIPVHEGRQYQVGRIDITGDTLDVSYDELLSNLEITQKDYFDRESVVNDIDYLTGACNNEGYAYANVIPHTEIDKEKQTISVTFELQKGNKVYIDKITVSGNTRTRDKVIRRQLRIVEGELYNRDKLTNSYESLEGLEYFEEVNFQTEQGSDESLMDVDVHVSEKATGLFSVGAGYSAQEKALFMAQIAERNLFGRGQTVSVSAHVGSSTTNYELAFVEPWLFDIPLWSKAEAWNMEIDRDFYDVKTKGVAGTLGYRLFEYVDGYVRYRYAENDVTNISPFASWYTRQQEGSTSSSGVRLTLLRDTKRPFMFPSSGSRNSVYLEYTGGIFQGDTSFIRYGAETRWYFPLPLDNVFSVKAEVGAISGQNDKEVPIYERFYMGGINSLRGLRDVGPRHPVSGEVIGGKTMMLYTAEWLFPLLKDAGVRGVVFYDTGNAWESGLHLDDMRQTAGAGIRWNSPIGPFRLEWGYVLDRKDGESPHRWEFTIGMSL